MAGLLQEEKSKKVPALVSHSGEVHPKLVKEQLLQRSSKIYHPIIELRYNFNSGRWIPGMEIKLNC